MNETKNLMNKKADELTVGDTLLVTAIAPILVIGTMAAAGGVIAVCSKTADKFKEVRENRKNKHLNVVK